MKPRERPYRDPAPPKRKTRPSKLTPEIEATICEYIATGNYRQVAGRAAGISKSTFEYWMRRGRDEPGTIYERFVISVEEAEGRAELHAVKLIIQAAAGDAKHAQWWLERKFPERWGRKDRLALTGKNDGPIETNVTVANADLTKLTDDELAALEAIAVRLTGPVEDPA